MDDGSTDATPEIAGRHPGIRLVRIGNRGLSAARNEGLGAATGEIVAYIDDDAYPDPHWLSYLAAAFRASDHAGIGGPNIPPPTEETVAEWVAYAPGGPVHVLLDDTVAEHLPGCNMAFRRECLEAIGGFDPHFRTAGDDVDLCWRLQARGWTLGFSPGAMVWHRRRNSVAAYWRQQKGYGRAEAMLERKWPEKYNAAGHVAWGGRVYGTGATRGFNARSRIYHGTWGSSPFQSVYQRTPTLIGSLPLMPEWYLIVGLLGMLSLLGLSWPPLLLAAPLFAAAVLVPLAMAVIAAFRNTVGADAPGLRNPYLLWLGSAILHLLQPVARLSGRLSDGLTPWRRHVSGSFALPGPRRFAFWSERSLASEAWLRNLEEKLREEGAVVVRGGDFDRWDLEVRSGAMGAARLRMGVEDHAGGAQMVRFRCWPRWRKSTLVFLMVLSVLTAVCVGAAAWLPAGVIGALTLAVGFRKLHDQASAEACVRSAVDILEQKAASPAPATAREEPSGPGGPAREAARVPPLSVATEVAASAAEPFPYGPKARRSA